MTNERILSDYAVQTGENLCHSGTPNPYDPMTISLITNLVFATLVVIAIPGLLAWAIRTSRNDGPPPKPAFRRPMPRPHFPAPRLSFGHRPRVAAREPVRDSR